MEKHKRESNYKIFLDISKEDLKASKVLFKHKLYPQSIFFLQQSTEKLVKFIGLNNEVIGMHNLKKKISHKTSLIFKEAISKFRPDLNKSDIDPMFQEVEYTINNEIYSHDVDKYGIKIALIEEIKDLIQDFWIKHPKIKEMTKEVKFINDKMPGYLSSLIILYIINALFERQVSAVRYPDYKMVNPTKKFNKNNPIVKELKFFHKNMDRCLRIVEKYETYFT